MPFGCADWRKNCSTPHSSCCGWHNHSPSRRSFGNSLCAGADWTNTAPSFHSYNCGRWNRSSRISFAHRRRNTTGNHCWYRWLPADSAIPMYDCRRRGKSTIHTNQNHGLYTHMFLDFEHNGTNYTRCTRRVRAMCAMLRRRFPGTNTSHTTGSCQ